MSGHSKWHNIQVKKGAMDARKGATFTKYAKMITIAARDGGADPLSNSTLRMAIEKAKAANLPNSNIERAIKKGTGEDKDGVQIEEIMYEGFGPAGIAVYVQVVTDNRNRSLQSVKLIMSKNGGTLGAAGSVAWMFEKKGTLHTDFGGRTEEEAELFAIDAGATDVQKPCEGRLDIYTEPTDVMRVKSAMETAGFDVRSAELTFAPKNYVNIDDKNTAEQILKLMDALDSDDDVTNVYANFDFPEGLIG